MFSQVILLRESNFIILTYFSTLKAMFSQVILLRESNFIILTYCFAIKVPRQNYLQNGVLNSPPSLYFWRVTTTTTATEEFSAKARPVIQRAQGLNIPFGKPLTPIFL